MEKIKVAQTAKKTYPKLSGESRRRAEVAIITKFQEMHPELKFESKDVQREERLIYVAEVLGRKHPIKSLKALSDAEVHFVLNEMSGKLKPAISSTTTAVNIVQTSHQHSEIVHLTSKEQNYAFDILFAFLEWTTEYKEDYLTKRWRRKSERMLTFSQANSLMMQLLNSAAHKDLKAMGKKTGRKENAKHIPILKRKLGLDQKSGVESGRN